MSVMQNYPSKTSALVSIPDGLIIMPGESASIPVNMSDQQVVVKPFQSGNWIQPQLASIQQQSLTITNTSKHPITSSKNKKANKFKITTTTVQDVCSMPIQDHRLNVNKQVDKLSQPETTGGIKFGDIQPDVKKIIDQAHNIYKGVFDKDLTNSYNHYFGKHVCKLNWASLQRPDARKVPVVNYDHDLKGIMQELCDHLTNQNVLKIPQEHNMFVHSVCPSFLQRKRRAMNTPKHLLTKNDCRLLINFGPINDLVCNIPSLMVTPMDVFDKLGRWKHIIVMNLYNAFYQNHMHQDDQPYLGIMTPFGGLRLLARSGQGLIGQREEMDELMAKVLHEEMKEGCITKIQDDVIIGGQTQIEAARNYVRVLRKLSLTNLKAEPEKINIFPVSADIAGWYWKRGGYLSVSPHRQCTDERQAGQHPKDSSSSKLHRTL